MKIIAAKLARARCTVSLTGPVWICSATQLSAAVSPRSERKENTKKKKQTKRL